MSKVLIYKPRGAPPPLYCFLDSLEPKLRLKLLWQMGYLANTPGMRMQEPHVKRFVVAKYSHLLELREKRQNIPVRIIFTVTGTGDILFLAPFIKKNSRSIIQAQELSLKMLHRIEKDPLCAVEFQLPKKEV